MMRPYLLYWHKNIDQHAGSKWRDANPMCPKCKALPPAFAAPTAPTTSLTPPRPRSPLHLHSSRLPPRPIMTEMPRLPTWPSHSVGPHTATRPISTPLLRLIPGSPRHGRPPVQWLQPTDANCETTPAQLYLTARLDDHHASIVLYNTDQSKWFRSRFDFNLPESSSLESTFSKHIRFTLSKQPTPHSNHDIVCLGSLLLTDIPLDAGELTCILHSPDPFASNPIARLRLTYLHATPSPHGATVAENILDCISPAPFAPRFTGHRGMGSSGPHAPHRPIENTVQSFAHAACTNDDRVRTVELDVQLTKDNQAVVYHDWFFRPRDEHGYPVYDRDSVRIPIRNLTLSQFDNLFRLSYTHNRNLEKNNQHLSEFFHPLPEHNLKAKAYSLRHICQSLPENVGILVELKYPAPDVQDMLSLPYPKRDQFVNTILNELFAHDLPKRKMAFLCFEPDICDMLALKQNSFPVYLSHCEALDKPCDEFDPRTISLPNGFDFVKAYQLHGLMMLNKLVSKHPSVISDITSENYPILTYGASNSDFKAVKTQFDAGVSGVIADDIHDMLKSLKDSWPPHTSKTCEEIVLVLLSIRLFCVAWKRSAMIARLLREREREWSVLTSPSLLSTIAFAQSALLRSTAAVALVLIPAGVLTVIALTLISMCSVTNLHRNGPGLDPTIIKGMLSGPSISIVVIAVAPMFSTHHLTKHHSGLRLTRGHRIVDKWHTQSHTNYCGHVEVRKFRCRPNYDHTSS